MSEYLQEIATREASRISSITPASGEEQAKVFLEWVKSFPGTPPLSADATEAGEGLSARTSATAAEKAIAFVQWAKGHRYTQPLSDEAISRASLYPDRW